MKKIVVGCTILYVIVIGVLGFCWSNKEHMTNEEYESLEVYYMPEKDYQSYPSLLEHVEKDEDIHTLANLETKSQLIVKARLKERIFVGNGVINECDVMSLYQGAYTKDTILIYEFVPFWSGSVEYFEGAVPLKKDQDYLMFLNPAPNPNVKDTYLFTSVRYGHIRLSEDITYHVAYDLEHAMKVQELSNYDFVGYDDRNLENYLRLHNEAYLKYQ